MTVYQTGESKHYLNFLEKFTCSKFESFTERKFHNWKVSASNLINVHGLLNKQVEGGRMSKKNKRTYAFIRNSSVLTSGCRPAISFIIQPTTMHGGLYR